MLLNGPNQGVGLLGLSASLSEYSAHYFLLNSGMDVQVNQAYCAAASVSAILNSLRFMHPRSEVGVDIPTDSSYDPYSYATQFDLFGDCTSNNVVDEAGSNAFDGWGSDGILSFPYGLTLEQTASLLMCHLDENAGWTVTVTHLDETHLTLSKMRYDMMQALSDASSRIVVNYHRAAAGQGPVEHRRLAGQDLDPRVGLLHSAKVHLVDLLIARGLGREQQDGPRADVRKAEVPVIVRDRRDR